MPTEMEHKESEDTLTSETTCFSQNELAQPYTSYQLLKEHSPKKQDLYEVLHSLIDTVSQVPTPSNEDLQTLDGQLSIITCNISEKIKQDTDGTESIMQDLTPSKLSVTDLNCLSQEATSITEAENEMVIEETMESNTPTKNVQNNDQPSCFYYNWNGSPKLLYTATKEYQPTDLFENFTKGCQWSPDGTCLLVPSEDFRIRVYELPRELYSGKTSNLSSTNLSPALSIKEGGLIYDSCWYPFMNSWEPVTCCFLSTSRESPAHLWDAFTGELRATYRAYNQVDEVEASISVQFINAGKEIWCGFKNVLRTFDTERPGRQVNTIEFKKEYPRVTGLVSCIRENPMMSGLVAFGTYSKCIGLYKNGPLFNLKTNNGVTQIEFSSCGTKLFSALRRSNEFQCWDLRNPGTVLYYFKGRESNTNQRIQFAIAPNGSQMVSGGTDGTVKVWELTEDTVYEEDLSPKYEMKLSEDCINGVSLHKGLPILATSSGQRLYDDETKKRDNSVRMWWIY